MRIYIISMALISQCWSKVTLAQKDTLTFAAGIYTSYATKPYQPLWIVSNQYDLIPDNPQDIILDVSGKYSLKFKSFKLETAAELVGNLFAERYWVQEFYGKMKFKTWQITGGREKVRVGEVDSLLSSGSLAISGNARPIPKVGVQSNGFVPVPILQWPWLQIKFSLLHGWMGQERVVKGSYLHEKSLYLKVGKEAINLYGGMAHFAIWGGQKQNRQLPHQLSDYFQVVIAASSKSKYGHQGLGDHMGVWDWGMNYQISQFHVRLYTQSIFERGYVPLAQEPAKSKGMMLLSRDRLVGASFQRHNKKWIDHMVLEYISTQYQGGLKATDGKYNYYNDATYASGWTYYNQIIGTPLFISRRQASNYFIGENNSNNWRSIMSNRIQGFHVGLSGIITQPLTYKTLITYTKHYGNFHNDELFTPSKRQMNALLELSWKLFSRLSVKGIFGVDRGKLSNNQGLLLGVEWIY